MALVKQICFEDLLKLQNNSNFSLIDVRSSSEWQLDNIPNSINLPVLNDDERAEIGTIYKQDSPFTARKKGAVYVAKNIALHIEKQLSEYEKNWEAAIYCWRGGQRSGSMALVLAQVGWQVYQLKGGYRSYRQWVLQQYQLPLDNYRFIVIAGKTGCGKSQLLQYLAKAGGQIIDLENLANHRGSVLGLPLNSTQPSQKLFESKLLKNLKELDQNKAIFIEAESQRIGKIQIPLNFYQQMLQGHCLEIITSIEERVNNLLAEYAFYFTNSSLLNDRLQSLLRFHGHEKINSWKSKIENKMWHDLVHELLTEHYDSRYHHAHEKHFRQNNIQQINCPSLDNIQLENLANNLVNEFN